MEQKRALRFEVGGIRFSFNLDDYQFGCELADNYEKFSYQGRRADARYTLHSGNPKFKDFGRLLFDSGGLWRIYERHGKRLIDIRHDSGLRKVCLLDDDFSGGDIYLDFPKCGDNLAEVLSHQRNPMQYPLDQLLMVGLLRRRSGMLVHSCGVADGGRGMLFVGASGAGKSTIASLWRDCDGVVLNDDRIILRRRGDAFRMYGTPWCGDFKESSPSDSKIDAVFFIEHGVSNSIVQLKPMDAITALVSNSFYGSWDRSYTEANIGVSESVAGSIGCFTLSFVPDRTAVDAVREFLG
jgi:hypothetical protein